MKIDRYFVFLYEWEDSFYDLTEVNDTMSFFFDDDSISWTYPAYSLTVI